MSTAFRYKPKFIDIRIRPPKEGEGEEEAAARDDVYSLKPGERACDHAGCRLAAVAKAPKSRQLMHDHYWFCQAHAAEYNKNWDFFSGMSEGEIRAFQEARFTGERPTWDFKASRASREAAAFSTGNSKGAYDPFSLFRGGARKAEPVEPEGRHLGKLERTALADLDLDHMAEPAAIRARYTELVKRCHPDANGGDRSAENKLQRVLKAFKTLRKAGHV
ncbi:MAG: DnaJ domain-containing protein [Caulobacteraceae bacterium]